MKAIYVARPTRGKSGQWHKLQEFIALVHHQCFFGRNISPDEYWSADYWFNNKGEALRRVLERTKWERRGVKKEVTIEDADIESIIRLGSDYSEVSPITDKDFIEVVNKILLPISVYQKHQVD